MWSGIYRVTKEISAIVALLLVLVGSSWAQENPPSLPETGYLRITSAELSDLAVTIGSESFQLAGKTAMVELKVGDHQVLVSAPGHMTKIYPVKIKLNEEQVLSEVDFEQAMAIRKPRDGDTAIPYYLVIETKPANQQVSLNDIPVTGARTPVTFTNLPAGNWKVKAGDKELGVRTVVEVDPVERLRRLQTEGGALDFKVLVAVLELLKTQEGSLMYLDTEGKAQLALPLPLISDELDP